MIATGLGDCANVNITKTTGGTEGEICGEIFGFSFRYGTYVEQGSGQTCKFGFDGGCPRTMYDDGGGVWELQGGSCRCLIPPPPDGGAIVDPIVDPVHPKNQWHPILGTPQMPASKGKFPISRGKKPKHVIVAFRTAWLTPKRRKKLRALLSDPAAFDAVMKMREKRRRSR